MAQHGGYRKPAQPAAVSGPGAHSKRTDGGPGVTDKQATRYISGQPYGEGQELQEVQSSAPLAAAPSQEVIPFDAPSMRPDEPVTTGIDRGDGAGPEALARVGTLQDDEPDDVAVLVRQAYAQFPSPHLRRMVEQLDAEGR